MNPRLSIIICTYNREKFLRDSLESIARQTADLAAYELVIVNNNSTDATDAICRNFLAQHPDLRATYVIEKQQGLSYARNRGIREAQGQFITYIDDDAIAEPEFVERILAFFHEHPEAVAVGGKVLARFESRPPAWNNPYSASLFFSHYDKGDRLFQYNGKGYPIGCNMTFRRDFFDRHGAFDTELGRKGKGGLGGEEKELFGRLIRAGLPYYYDPRQVVHHQIDDFRQEYPYTHKLARGLGYSHRRLYCSHGFSWSCLRALLLILAKLGAAILLATGYLLRGRLAVSRHLIWYRWQVVKGFLVGRE